MFRSKVIFLRIQINTYLFKTDNSTVLSHIDTMGGMHSKQLNDHPIKIWNWCIKREIFIAAQYLPGCENFYADLLSR